MDDLTPHKARRRAAFVAVVALLGPHLLLAQTGALKGVVTAADTHAPVGGACVSLAPPSCAVLTDAHGVYFVRGVPAGAATVTVTASGSEPARDTVTVADGQTVTLDVALAPGPLLLSSIVVTATRSPTEAERVATTMDVLTAQLV